MSPGQFLFLSLPLDNDVMATSKRCDKLFSLILILNLVRKQMLAVKINKVKQSLLTGSSRLRDFLQIGSLAISLHLISYSASCSIKFTTLCSVVQHIVWTDFWKISLKFIVHVDYLSTVLQKNRSADGRLLCFADSTEFLSRWWGWASCGTPSAWAL